MDIAVNQRCKHIHDQNGVANTFNMPAAQTNKGSKDTETDSKDDTPAFGQRTGHPVSCHEKGTNQQAAAQQMVKREKRNVSAKIAVNTGNNKNRQNIVERNAPVNAAAPDQKKTTQENQGYAGLAKRTGNIADEHACKIRKRSSGILTFLPQSF